MKLPRFTLRELFLLVVIAAMGCGWWVDHRFLRAENNKMRDPFYESLAEERFNALARAIRKQGFDTFVEPDSDEVRLERVLP